MNIKIGDLVGDYIVTESVGAMPWGWDFIGSADGGRRRAVIKALSAEAGSPDTLAGLRHGLPGLQRLPAAAIASPSDLVTVEGTACLVVLLGDGVPLLHWLSRRLQETPVETLQYIFKQVVSVLEAAHALDICHGNLRPDCIYVSQNAQVRVGELGMAQWVASGAGRPPKATEARDLHALGLLAFVLTTGSLPFKHPHEWIEALDGKPLAVPVPSRYNPALPTSIDAFVAQATHADPSQRFDSLAPFKSANLMERTRQGPALPSARPTDEAVAAFGVQVRLLATVAIAYGAVVAAVTMTLGIGVVYLAMVVAGVAMLRKWDWTIPVAKAAFWASFAVGAVTGVIVFSYKDYRWDIPFTDGEFIQIAFTVPGFFISVVAVALLYHKKAAIYFEKQA